MAPRKVGALPPPPPNLDTRTLPILIRRDALVRVHWLVDDPAFWGKTGRNRFDAPGGEFGVLYAAADAHGAFIEACGDTGIRALTTTSLSQRGWARITPNRDLRLVDLSGPGLAHIDADERLCSGEHDIAQQWSLALWRHPAAADGLYYRARHDPSRVAVALFDRTASAVSVLRDGALLDDRYLGLLAEILEAYQFSLL